MTPLIACSAFLLSLALVKRRWQALRLGSAKPFSPYAEIVVLLLLGLAFFFVMRPIHLIQLEVRESDFNKVVIGTLGQLELILLANAWLPWLVSATCLSLMGAHAARLRQAAPGVAEPRLPQLWGIGLALIVAGIVPLAWAIRRYAQAGLAVIDARTSDSLVHFLREKAMLPQALRAFYVTVLVAAVVLTVAYWRRARFRAEPTSRNSRSGGAWLGTGACLGLSLFFFWMTKPLSAELLHPFPTDHNFLCVEPEHQPPHALLGVGPDSVVEAPMVAYRYDYSVDGTGAGSVQSLNDILGNKANLWRQVHPQQDFPGIVIVFITGPMSLQNLQGALTAFVQSGYFAVYFLLADVIRTTQPFFGPCQGVRSSAVRLRVVGDPSRCAGASNERIWLPIQGRTEEFVYGLIPLRKQGKMPCWVLPASPDNDTQASVHRDKDDTPSKL